MKIYNPSNDELIKDIPIDTADSIRMKYDFAREAQVEWAKVDLDKRIEIIDKFKSFLEKNIEKASKILTEEMGKPLAHAKGEINVTLTRIQWFLDNIKDSMKAKSVHMQGDMNEIITYEPLGVIANISAWNFPYFVGTNVFIPALLTGNAVLYKPSEFSALTGLLIEELMLEAGLPEGLFQSVIGAGKEGSYLLDHNIDGVFFTGSYGTGRKIAQAINGRFIKLQLELGGKDPAYVCEDMDPKKVAHSVGDGAFFNAGQSCCAVERIYVHEKIYDQFCGELKLFAEGLKVGDPMQNDTYIGPLTRKEQIKVLKNQVHDAVDKGATLLTGGNQIGETGAFFEVTVINDATHNMVVMQEESFGPIIAVQKVGCDKEAINLMQDTEYGLTASVHTLDEDRAVAILKQMNTGTVYWNCCDRVSPYLPWTGRKNSGMGSTLSCAGILAFVQPKAWHLRKTI